MEKSLMIIEIGKIVLQIIWAISIFWLGCLIGQQKTYTRLMDKDYDKFKEELQEARKNLKNM